MGFNLQSGLRKVGLTKKKTKQAMKLAPEVGGAIGFALGGPAGAAIGSGIGNIAAGRGVDDALRNGLGAYGAGTLGTNLTGFSGFMDGSGLLGGVGDFLGGSGGQLLGGLLGGGAAPGGAPVGIAGGGMLEHAPQFKREATNISPQWAQMQRFGFGGGYGY